MLKAEEASVHKAEKYGEQAAEGNNSGNVHMFEIIQQEAADDKAGALPHIPEHNAEHKGIGQSHKFCRVQFIVGRQDVYKRQPFSSGTVQDIFSTFIIPISILAF